MLKSFKKCFYLLRISLVFIIVATVSVGGTALATPEFISQNHCSNVGSEITRNQVQLVCLEIENGLNSWQVRANSSSTVDPTKPPLKSRNFQICVAKQSQLIRLSLDGKCKRNSEFKNQLSTRVGPLEICVSPRTRNIYVGKEGLCSVKGAYLVALKSNIEILACADKATGVIRWPRLGICWWENTALSLSKYSDLNLDGLEGSGGQEVLPGSGAVRTKGRIQVLEILQNVDGSVTTKNDGRFENKVSPVLNSKSTQNNSGVLQTYSSQKVLMSGSGYEPFSLVSIWANSTPTFLGSVNTNSIGSFSIQVAIPPDFQSGSHVLTTSGVIDGQEFTSSIGFQNFTTQSEVPIGKKLDPKTSATLSVSPTSSIALPTSTSSSTTTTSTTSTTSPTTTTTIPATLPITTTTIAATLTVTYDSQGGSAISSGSTTVGGSISASPGTPTRTGYTFNGWFVATSGGSQIVFPYTHGQTANFTLYAQWTGNSQTISYAAGTGGSGSAPSSPTSVLYGSTFTTPANTYTRSGYTFAGWNDGSTTYAAGVTYPSSGTVAGPVTLTATWTATTLTVTYDSQGGSAISSGSTTVGGSISASPGTPTRTGYTFNGWFVASSGGSQIVFPYTHGQTAAFTLYAQWTGITLTISYLPGTGNPTGNAPSSPTSVLYGSTFITPANTYARSGKTFGGWSDGTNTYAAGATYPSSGTVTGNVTLTATWV